MEESSLRWVLLVVGIVILAAIYLFDVLQKRSRRDEADSDRFFTEEKIEPSLIQTIDDTATEEALAEEIPAGVFDNDREGMESVTAKASLDSQAEDLAVPVAEQASVIQLAVLAKQGEAMSGGDLVTAFTEVELEFGDMGIFHCYKRLDGVENQLFHVANLLEPGTFPVGSMSDFQSTGIILFFQVSDLIDPHEAFDSMLNTARELSQRFSARLVDETMEELSLDKIADIQTRLGS
jgi:cell division protein ZipA